METDFEAAGMVQLGLDGRILEAFLNLRLIE